MDRSTAAETAMRARPKEDAAQRVDALERAFARVVQILKTRIREFAAQMHPELRPAGWQVLRTVLNGAAAGEQVTVGEIITDTAMDKSVVSRQLRTLKEWDFVRLRRSEIDARVFVAEPTEKALARYELIRAERRAEYARILDGWSDEDLDRLEELLLRLAEASGT